MIGFDLRGVPKCELQERFRIAPEAPDVRDRTYTFHFIMDQVHMGLMELFVDLNDQQMIWWVSRPFCPHASEEEIRSTLPDQIVRELGLRWLQITQGDWQAKHPGLEGTGLGTHAHALILQWLSKNMPDPGHFGIKFSKSVDPVRLRPLLKRLGIDSMIGKRMSLSEIWKQTRTNAERLFGFHYDE